MATTYDKASLVMIPSGYKDDKLYSVKPTDGSGDFTFSRDGAGASPSTRVNASGLIEKGYTNNVLQSNTFSSGTWLKQVSGGTTPVLTSGFPDPEGGSNAWRLQCSISGGLYSMMSQALSTAGLNCNSIWIKSNTGSDQDVYFRINNADQTTTRTATATWQRIEVFTDAVGQSFTIGVRNAATGSTSSCDVLIYAAQSNEGLVGLPIVETTTAPVSAGLLGDMPRLDYSGGATCPSLLLEPSRTNLVTQSEYFNSWSLTSGGAGSAPVVTANYGVSPEGLQNAARVQFNAGGATAADSSTMRQLITLPASSHTMSIYVKSLSGTANLAFTFNSAAVGTISATDSEWTRFDYTGTGTGALSTYGVQLKGDVTDQTADVLVYAAQVEAGSYPTSYIPTYGSASTRGNDASILNGASSIIGQSEGTMFVEAYLDVDADQQFFRIAQAGLVYTNAIYIDYRGGNIRGNVWASSALQARISDAVSTSQNVKIAFAYKANDFVLYVNGTQVGTDTSGSLPTSLASIDLGSDSTASKDGVVGGIKQSVLFPTRLTNAELAALTA